MHLGAFQTTNIPLDKDSGPHSRRTHSLQHLCLQLLYGTKAHKMRQVVQQLQAGPCWNREGLQQALRV